MDDRGRLAQPLIGSGPPGGAYEAPRRAPARGGTGGSRVRDILDSLKRQLRRIALPLFASRVPRFAGLAATLTLIAASGVFGMVKGGHVPEVIEAFKDLRDSAANAAGFRIASIAMVGQRHVSREEILATAGVTGHTSLLFLDAEAARLKLKANPWIAEATVLKLYPDRLHVAVVEREAFALWQHAGRVAVIAKDGAVLESFVDARFATLPLVVGKGAEQRAQDFLALMQRYPSVRTQLAAGVLVAERRWNLRLKNGIDIRLPENAPERALDALVALDRDNKLLSRDIVAVDLRLPDRVAVQLSDAAAKAREEALKAKNPKRKGGDA